MAADDDSQPRSTLDELRPGTLWKALRTRTEEALRSGALAPLVTRQETVDDEGIPFVVRTLEVLERKAAARLDQGRGGANPFLPPEPALTVGALSSSHVCVLNKFNVFGHHLLIVTREFQPQQSPLDARDFSALAACLAEVEGLGFYNSGKLAGASQEHKHLQLVPFPLGAGTEAAPIELALDAVEAPGVAIRLPKLRFDHAVVRLGETATSDPSELQARLIESYEALGRFAELDCGRDPHNLLATRRWAMLVPRRHECYEGISVNALGFAGSLLVRSRAQLDLVKRLGPLNMLAAVAGRADPARGG